MKIGMTSEEYKKVHDEYKNYAFTVTGVESNEQVQNILDELIQNREAGGGYKEFAAKMKEKGLSPNALVYWQNIRACQNAGQYQQMMEDIDVAPYWQYMATKDDLTRQEHLAMQGLVRKYDDPIWDEWYPPNGFRCRCRVRSLSREYVKSKLGLQESDIPSGMPDMNEMKKNMGSRFSVQFALDIEQHRDKETGLLMMKPDAGFSGNVGKDMYGWLKIKNTTDKTNWMNVVKNKINLQNELKKYAAVDVSVLKIDDKMTLQEKIKHGADFLKNDLKSIMASDNVLLDKFGNHVYIADWEGFVKHLIDKDSNRLSLLPCVKELLTNPQMVIQDIVIASGKMTKKGMCKIGRIYSSKVSIDGKEKNISIVSSITNEHNEGFTIWTMYMDKSNDGVIVYKL